ncbi:MAG: ABC transporter permease subunit, partial [Akkermansia sp.]|nr:ABC transporter permease subunit [Akkermansia sp.]
IEIVSQLPFLFVVMILSDLVPLELRGMILIMGLLAMFGWMQMTYLIRTATMREKTRDYVAAARVMGAGPFYIMRNHILPNLVSIIVTLVPFSIAAVILSLASLDYMGFGLPDSYASWGRLLNDGLAKLSCPWVVSAAFTALVATLLLVTFIGEAVREAFDPHRHSYYE